MFSVIHIHNEVLNFLKYYIFSEQIRCWQNKVSLWAKWHNLKEMTFELWCGFRNLLNFEIKTRFTSKDMQVFKAVAWQNYIEILIWLCWWKMHVRFSVRSPLNVNICLKALKLSWCLISQILLSNVTWLEFAVTCISNTIIYFYIEMHLL